MSQGGVTLGGVALVASMACRVVSCALSAGCDRIREALGTCCHRKAAHSTPACIDARRRELTREVWVG